MRSALERGDPLMCIVSDATIADARVRALVPLVTARGPIVNWTRVTRDARVLQVMRLLVRTYGYPANAAAGLAGNFIDESNMLPQRVQGSADDTPMRAPNLAGRVTDFTAADVMNRNEAHEPGPLPAGCGPGAVDAHGEAQWDCSRTPSAGGGSVRECCSTWTRRWTMRRRSCARRASLPCSAC